jgi:hypothetical protein
MFRTRHRSESNSPTAPRGAVGSARVWDAHTRARHGRAGERVEEQGTPPPGVPEELRALVTRVVGATLDVRLADLTRERRKALARELEQRLFGLLEQPDATAPPAPETRAAASPPAPAPPARLSAPSSPGARPLGAVASSPRDRALELVLDDRLERMGGTLALRADLRQRLVSLALLAPHASASDAGASREELRSLDVLQRRAVKLEGALREARAALAYVAGLPHVDEGLASIYRTVQGLRRDDPHHEQKRGALEGVFRANLALQKPPGPPLQEEL